MASDYKVAMDSSELQKLENRFASIVDRIIRYHPEPDVGIIRRAFDFALEMHAGQVRKSGEPYLSHPLEVLDIIAELKLDTASLVAGILHDTVEDTDTTVEELAERFGSDVAFLVDGVTKLTKLKFNTREEAQAENIRKMIIAMSRDLRVILVKLADRLHNMRTLKHMPREKQRRIATETMDIYAPMAHRLGISWIKTELEDLSFQYLYPEDYYDIAEQVSRRKRERESFIREVMNILRELLEENHVQATISGRPKNFWSIYRKMRQNNVEFKQIFDILAFRIIVDETHQCYEALGLVHNLWKPIPGRFKDYIAVSKPNGYQSLHTSVIGPMAERIEIQIRTHEMHKVAEEGIAAHWLYKEGRAVADKDDKKFAWLHQLMEDHQDSNDPYEFLESVKIDLFHDEVYVFTPAGDVKGLPRGATVIDFAYAIHTEVGDHCTGGVVNGRMVPIKQTLETGDICEIVTSKNQKPNKAWLDFVVSGRAKTKIRNAVREEERLRSRELGRELLDKELRKKGSAYATLSKNGELAKYIESSRFQSENDMLTEVGYGKTSIASIISKILPEPETSEESAEPKKSQKTSTLGALWRKLRTDENVGVEIDGISNIMVNYANCCRPVPGEDIVGFVTRGRGLSVHVRGCSKVEHLDPARFIDVHWKGTQSNSQFKVNLTITSSDQPGMLAKIAQTMADASVNISKANSTVDENDSRFATHTYEVMVKNSDHLQDMLRRLRRIKGVIKVKRESLEGK